MILDSIEILLQKKQSEDGLIRILCKKNQHPVPCTLFWPSEESENHGLLASIGLFGNLKVSDMTWSYEW